MHRLRPARAAAADVVARAAAVVAWLAVLATGFPVLRAAFAVAVRLALTVRLQGAAHVVAAVALGTVVSFAPWLTLTFALARRLLVTPLTVRATRPPRLARARTS